MAFFGNGYKALGQGGQFILSILDSTLLSSSRCIACRGLSARCASVPDTLAAASSVGSDSRSAVRATFSAVFSTSPPIFSAVPSTIRSFSPWCSPPVHSGVQAVYRASMQPHGRRLFSLHPAEAAAASSLWPLQRARWSLPLTGPSVPVYRPARPAYRSMASSTLAKIQGGFYRLSRIRCKQQEVNQHKDNNPP